MKTWTIRGYDKHNKVVELTGIQAKTEAKARALVEKVIRNIIYIKGE